jgi:acetyl esterase/lipase
MQYEREGTWSQQSNLLGWWCLLGDETVGGDDVPVYAAPGRVVDLVNLPRAFIDVGSAETLRDEAVAYATVLWEAGVQIELHVWPGMFHGSEELVPQAALSKASKTACMAWVIRTLAVS